MYLRGVLDLTPASLHRKKAGNLCPAETPQTLSNGRSSFQHITRLIRILPYLRSIASYMHARGQPYEVLVVDDGSTDATASIVEDTALSAPEIQLLRAPLRRGKGAAVRRGMQAAVGRLQLFTDADGATPIQELARLEEAMANGADVAIGSRALASQLPGYAVQTRWYRTILSNLFKSLIQQRGLRGIADTQCGFKLFRQSVATDLFGVSSIDGYGFRPRTALCGTTTRIPHRRNSGELVPSVRFKVSRRQRWVGYATRIGRDSTESGQGLLRMLRLRLREIFIRLRSFNSGSLHNKKMLSPSRMRKKLLAAPFLPGPSKRTSPPRDAMFPEHGLNSSAATPAVMSTPRVSQFQP